MNNKKIAFICGILYLVFPAQIHRTFSQKNVDRPANFIEVVENIIKKNYSKTSLNKICPIESDPVANRVFKEYGAIFISNNSGILPAKCVFDNENQVRNFQSQVKTKTSVIGKISITLQESAMNALLEAQKDAAKKNLRITPRSSSVSATRSYQDTARMWNSRFFPALNYWVGKGKISRNEAENAKKLPIYQQVARVLEWENKGFYFSKDLSKSILFSVAVPGASQHVFMLALDIDQFSDLRVRNILAEHGWFQTVKSDLPHFTYIGVEEKKLPQLGLRLFSIDGHKFWLTNY